MSRVICTITKKSAGFGACKPAIPAMDGRKCRTIGADLECRKNPVLMDSPKQETTSCPTIPHQTSNPAGPVQEACLSPLSSSSYSLLASLPLAAIPHRQRMEQPHQRPQMTPQLRLQQVLPPNRSTPQLGPTPTTHTLFINRSRPLPGRLHFAVRGVPC